MSKKQKLPTLYKKTSTGAIQQWRVWVEDSTILTEYGQVGGKLQTTQDTIKEGKNLGRKNATTAEEQAQTEAAAQHEKKLKKGYVLKMDDAEAGKVADIIEGGIFPMLAERFDKQGDKIVYPAYAQPKLDGHRMTAQFDARVASLWSRSRKPITSLPHIVAELATTQGWLPDDRPDGEAYNDAYHDKFEELSSFIRPQEPKPGCEVVEYHLYDIAGAGTFEERNARLQAVFAGAIFKYLKYVKTVLVNNEDELMAAFETFLEQDYEGAIVRNAAGLYVYKRTVDLQKLKTFQDSEFKITGVIEGRGKLAKHGIFVCETDKGVKFEAKMIGKIKALKKFYEKPDLAIGKMLTVQYQGFTSKSGVPRFPVARCMREDI